MLLLKRKSKTEAQLQIVEGNQVTTPYAGDYVAVKVSRI